MFQHETRTSAAKGESPPRDRDALDIARLGLSNRGLTNRDGYDETSFLAPLDEVVARGTTSAAAMIKAYHTRRERAIGPVFLENAT